MVTPRNWDEFYEELRSDDYMESLDINDSESYNGGLTNDNVHKLTEDLMNPLPPLDSDNK